MRFASDAVSLELISSLRAVLVRMRDHDDDLAEQMRSGASSITLGRGRGMHGRPEASAPTWARSVRRWDVPRPTGDAHDYEVAVASSTDVSIEGRWPPSLPLGSRECRVVSIDYSRS